MNVNPYRVKTKDKRIIRVDPRTGNEIAESVEVSAPTAPSKPPAQDPPTDPGDDKTSKNSGKK